MKKFFLPDAFFLLVVVFVLFSCSERQQLSGGDVSGGRPALTLAEIKRSFEKDYSAVPQTRADEGFDEDNVLAPGWIIPSWDSVSYYCGGDLLQASTEFSAQFGYRVLYREQAGYPVILPMPGQLVVFKDRDTGETASYLRFFIPDENLLPEARFSGLVLYTMLSGHPVSVGRFSDGVLSDTAFLWDEGADKMEGLLRNIYVARIRSRAATRGIYDDNKIDAVEVVGVKPIKINWDWKPNLRVPPKDFEFQSNDALGGGSGGSGGSGNGNGSNGSSRASYMRNSKITIWDKNVKDVLDSLYRDCMGQLLINSIRSSVSIQSGYFGASTTNPEIIDFPYGGRFVSQYIVQIGSRCDPVSIMEELMHVYQGLGSIEFAEARINNEVEAKLAWYMYMKRNNGKMNFESALGGREGVSCFDDLYKYVLDNDLNNPGFFEAYENAVDALRTIRAYKDEKRYPFDPGKMNVNKLLELLRDC